MNKTFRSMALALALCLPAVAFAHKAFLLPSATVLSDGEDAWITLDAAMSNDLFNFNHVPLGLDALSAVAPDGRKLLPENASTGKYRTTFDLHLTQQGTYRVALANEGLMANYVDAKGEKKRLRGRDTLDIPAGAKDVKVTQVQNRIETFVTLGNPGKDSLKPIGSGLELAPVTHPNDLFSGEQASFRLLIDGKPASGVEVEVIRGDTRYRDRQDEIKATTDADGKFAITWPQAGMYWLHAAMDGAKASNPQASARRAAYTATLEVLPQ